MRRIASHKDGSVRRYAVALATLSPEDACESDLLDYLSRIKLLTKLTLDLQMVSDRVVELFFRTNQMQFNKACFPDQSEEGIAAAIERHLSHGSRLAVVSLSMGDADLGIQGAFLYSVDKGSSVVWNATFSCSIIPFRVVESIALSDFVNAMLT